MGLLSWQCITERCQALRPSHTSRTGPFGSSEALRGSATMHVRNKLYSLFNNLARALPVVHLYYFLPVVYFYYFLCPSGSQILGE